MKLLFVHADHLEYETKKAALKSAPMLAPGEEKGAADEALVVFYSVEKGDELDVAGIVEQAVANVQDVARQVKPNEVVCYPYAHLSSDLARPSDAIAIGKAFAKAVADAGFKTKTSPFGWYKAFKLHAKGHPLSELSRSIRPAASHGVAVIAHEQTYLRVPRTVEAIERARAELDKLLAEVKGA